MYITLRAACETSAQFPFSCGLLPSSAVLTFSSLSSSAITATPFSKLLHSRHSTQCILLELPQPWTLFSPRILLRVLRLLGGDCSALSPDASIHAADYCALIIQQRTKQEHDQVTVGSKSPTRGFSLCSRHSYSTRKGRQGDESWMGYGRVKDGLWRTDSREPVDFPLCTYIIYLFLIL
jgi:hypothetical protein